ncbi:tetraspanin-7-like isoform X4 [Dreissena polymorpha]|uniref:tetraspanin-7-like isoform X4 n=1 Tax=Dreissena polymorpha TaxID=45954 RepID=UPI002263C529|nr:tetraspanin-7-like isoform X4 [Dreissena polymorpha]
MADRSYSRVDQQLHTNVNGSSGNVQGESNNDEQGRIDCKKSGCDDLCKPCSKKKIALEIVNLGTAVYGAILACMFRKHESNIYAIQQLLQIYGLETNVGRVRCGIKYTIFGAVMFVAYLTFGFESATFDCQFDDGLEVTLNNSVNDDYIVGKGLVAKAWDEVQLELSCCGVVGPKDYSELKFNDGNYVPVTCCKQRPFNETMCQFEAYQLQHNQTNDGRFVNKVGCFGQIKSKFHDYLTNMEVHSFVISGLQLLCFIMALIVVCCG